MKLFLLDKGLTLLVGGLIIVSIPSLFGPIASIILELLTVIVWSFWCKQLLLLPLDIHFGKKTIICYFHSCLSIDNYEFFRKRGFSKWRFVYENRVIDLTVPLSCLMTNIMSENIPPNNELIIITYYPLSGVLYSWELA